MYRRAILTLCAFAALGTLCAPAFADHPPRNGVTLYENDDFGGRHQTFYDDVPYLSDTQFGNDRASSIRVDPGCRAILYKDAEYRGPSTLLDRDAPNLTTAYVGNDAVSSLQVDCAGDGRYGDPVNDRAPAYGNPGRAGGVTLYTEQSFGGRSETFYSDDPGLQNNDVGNDTVSSVRVAPGCAVTLFENYDYGGRSVTLTRDAASFSGLPIGNDRVSSVRVDCGATTKPTTHDPRYDDGRRENRHRYDSDHDSDYDSDSSYRNRRHPHDGPPGQRAERGATLYRNKGYRGDSQRIYEDHASLKRTRIGNNRVSSVEVDPGCRVILYADENFRGRSLVLHNDLHDFEGTPMKNDSVSSVQVDCRSSWR